MKDGLAKIPANYADTTEKRNRLHVKLVCVCKT
jgi:hypothetical protein